MSLLACRHGTGPAPSPQGWRASRATRVAAGGLDRVSPARQGLAKQVSTRGNVSFPVGTAVVPSGDMDVLASCEQPQAPSASVD